MTRTRSGVRAARARPYNPAMPPKSPRNGDTPMNVEELKSHLERARQHSKDNTGKVLMCTDRGPAGFDLIQAIITVVEQQQREIEEIKARFIS
jgi:hypothetical protein